jgi:endoglucanase
VSGGWHDAGDYGRYVVAGAVAAADLLEAYEDFEVAADDMGIPESGNGIPDILDEAKYELDWMLKMQDEESGGVYHKVTCFVFPETVNPEEEKDQLYLAPVSQAATGDFAAIMAKASVVYKDFDPTFSTEARLAAEKAWEYLVSDETDKSFKNPEEFETGEYPDKYITDERYWAAVELYLAGKEDMNVYVTKYGKNEKIKHGLGWADVATYADYDLAKYAQEEMRDMAIEHISSLAEEQVEKADKSGYYTTFGSDYAWGSNMAVGNSGQLLYMAANVTGDEYYAEIARKQLDYLLGTNPLGYCYVTGYGTFAPQNPHHRPSQVKGSAMTGMLVGGPNKNLDDPYAAAVLSAASPAMCYVDNVQSYSTNEISIYWNSPLIYLLAAEQQIVDTDEFNVEED